MTSELLPCPFCGIQIKRVESWARAFTPFRLFHEYHHEMGGTCHTRHQVIWSGEAGSELELAFIAAWNTRSSLTEQPRDGLAGLARLLHYHETGGHEGDCSDETLAAARAEITALSRHDDTTVERVARAISDANWRDGLSRERLDEHFNDEILNSLYLKQARAAIAALRDPGAGS